MLKILKNSFIILFFYSSAIFGRPAPVLKIKGRDNKIIENYLLKHKEFSTKLCRSGAEQKYWNLYSKFRGDGHYIPVMENDKLDKLTINRFIPELERKLSWIKSLKSKVLKFKDFKPLRKDLELLQKDLDKLLEYKQVYFEDKLKANRKKARNRSKYLFIKFKVKLKKYLEKINFLVSYRYPVDHVELRETYDLVKEKRTKEERKRSNEIYFYRKIVQDGALNPDHSRSDKFLRANLDNIMREFLKSSDLLTENLRYDLNSAFSGLDRILKSGKKYQLKRIGEWEDRSTRNLSFYKRLQQNIVFEGKKKITADDLVKERASARYSLKQYVLQKEAESFKFWMKENELNRSLFSIETILYNEVGAIDGKDALERKDVTQVVINRRFLSEYNQIDPTEPLYDYLKLGKGKPLTKYPWLNLLFKEGEFSFTYFFIGGSLRIFCPEQTRYGKILRKQNLFLALKLLRNPNPKFDAVRYFSRAAMLGRIDMRSLWADFIPLPEREGRYISSDKHLKKSLSSGNYKFFYQFENQNGIKLKVLEIKKKTYVYAPSSKKFYKYRNPHYFTYFKKSVKRP